MEAMDNFDLGYFLFMDAQEKKQNQEPTEEDEEAGGIIQETDNVFPKF